MRKSPSKLRQAPQDNFRLIFESSPVAIWEEDFSSLADLRDIIEQENISDVRKFLAQNSELVVQTFRRIKILNANRAALTLYGARSRQELMSNRGKTITKDLIKVLVDEFATLLSGQLTFVSDLKSPSLKGDIHDVLLRVAVPEMYKHNFKRVIVTLEDITAQKRLEARLKRMAQTDGLTDLYNHRSIISRLEEEVIRARRYKAPLSCMMIDLDLFKLINDRFGHPRGDKVLKITAAVLKGSLRVVDFVGRYGGDEFLIVLPETSAENACVAARRLQQQLASRLKPDEQTTMSIGVAGFDPEKVKDVKSFIVLADQAMYQAKVTGGNKIVVL